MRSLGHDQRKRVRAPVAPKQAPHPAPAPTQQHLARAEDMAQGAVADLPTRAGGVGRSDLFPPDDAKVPSESFALDLRRARVHGLRHACPAEATHAFREAAAHVLAGRHDLAEGRLTTYYARWCPRNAAAVVGLPGEHELADYPALAAVLPWFGMTPGSYMVALEVATRGHYLQRGMSDWGMSDGHTQFGPASRRRVRAEVARLAELIASVREHGPRDDCPPILGMRVEDDREASGDRWVFDVRDGIHRVAVFSAMGMGGARAQVVSDLGSTVRRSESALWPQVQSGLFTEDEALQVFDDYVRGRPL